jgi:hypothetical protein
MGVDVDEGERDVPKKSLSGQPEKHRGIFADGPQHAQAFKMFKRFSKNINALLFQLVQNFHF